MDYIKQEESASQIYSTGTEFHNVIFQNQHMPLNIIEQLQMAVQNGVTLDPHLQSIILKQPFQQLLKERDNLEESEGSMISQRRLADPNIFLQNRSHHELEKNSEFIDRNVENLNNLRQNSVVITGSRNGLGVSDHIGTVSMQDQRNSPICLSDHRSSPAIISDHRNSPMILMPERRNSPVIISDGANGSVIIQEHKNSQVIIQEHRNSPVVLQEHRNSPVVIQDHRNSPIALQSNSTVFIQDNGIINVQNTSLSSNSFQGHRIQPNQVLEMQNQRVGNVQENAQVNLVDRPAGQLQAVLNTSGRLMLPSAEGQFPLPFAIKSESEPEENPYYYEQIMQAYVGCGNLLLDQPPTSSVDQVQQTNAVQYVYSGQITSTLPQIPTIDTYGRQQFFQNYTTDNAQNLVVHRQTQFDSSDLKRERAEILNKIQGDSLKHNNFYSYEPWSGEKSENDASVQNKIPPPDDVAYKSLIEAEYANIKGEYFCVKCNSIFPTKRGLKQHMKNCIENGSGEKMGKFSCTQCPYKCQSPAILKIHERTHTGEKPFSCNFCDYKSGQKNNVAKHILVHMKEKPFHCQYCDYKCAQKNNLVVHERTHTGFKPFACTLCEYKTVQKPNLVKHMYLHSGQKPFSCDLCSYRCVQKTNLMKHKQRHLNEKPGEKFEFSNENKPYRPRQKSFKCHMCSFRSTQKVSLDKHLEFSHKNSSESIPPDCGSITDHSNATAVGMPEKGGTSEKSDEELDRGEIVGI